MRVDQGMRTAEQLLIAFLQSLPAENLSHAYRQGALDSAIAVITKDERYRGIFDFALWYYELLQKERLA